MEVTLNAGDLQKVAAITQRAVATQSSMPILTNVLIEVGETNVTFTANDVESYVRCVAPAVGAAQPGQATAPGDTLQKLSRELPGDALVRMKTQDLTLHVETRTGESARPSDIYRLTGMPPEDFPRWPTLKVRSAIEIPQRVFKSLIDRTIYAVAAQDPRKVFLGLLMELKDSRLRVVGTDGKKLAWAQCAVSQIEGDPQQTLIVPQKTMREIAGALSGEGVVRIQFAGSQAAFEIESAGGRTFFISNSIEGRFPNYEAVVPREFTADVVANVESLARLLRRAAVVAADKNAPVVFEFQPNLCKISATSFDLGSFEGEIPVVYDGKPLEMAFNYRYVLETLKVVETADVRLRVKSPAAPALFLPTDRDDVLYLVMPIRLSDIRPAVQPEPEPPEEEYEEEAEEPGDEPPEA